MTDIGDGKEAIYARSLRVGMGTGIDEQGVRDVLALAFKLPDGGELRVVLDGTPERIDRFIEALLEAKKFWETRVPPPGSYWEG